MLSFAFRPRVLAGLLLLSGPFLEPGTSPASAAASGNPAVAEAAHDGEEPRVEVRLLTDREVARAGEPFRAGAFFRTDPGWHIYWRNPGQAGLPTELSWDIPDARIGPIQWPRPRVFRESGGFVTTYGYQGEVLLSQEITLSEDGPGRAELALTADFLACHVLCIPGRVELTRALDVGAKSRASADSPLFDRYSALVPVSPRELGLELDVAYSQSAIRPGDAFRLALGAAYCTSDADECSDDFAPSRPSLEAFVPDTPASLEIEVTSHHAHPRFPNGFLLTADARAGSDFPADQRRLRGVLRLSSPQGPRAVEVDVPLPRALPGAEVEELFPAGLEPRPAVGLARGLGLALLGGLILNLMPCVLPVLAIKLFGVTEAAQTGAATLRRSGLAYTAGILASMLVLGAVVIGLRAAGTAVGWGFQFQEPLFVVGISAVVLVFALNLFGVFEISLGSSRLGAAGTSGGVWRRSFFDGLLAVVLATPCSAPFLGTAVGFSLASPPATILAIFCAVGAGLALPYLALSFVPAWARWVPRPGPWMLRVRTLLGFALLATLVWLLWLTGRTAGVAGLVGLLVYLLGLALATWLFGVLQAGGNIALARTFGACVLLTAALGARALPLGPVPGGVETRQETSGPWRGFEPEAVRTELESGRPVFVDFTADWCLTCKANERLVIDTAAVREAVARYDVALFRADWTRRDESIRRVLSAHGRAGVPLYLVYSPARPTRPQILPELLSARRLIEALRSAAVPPASRPGVAPRTPTGQASSRPARVRPEARGVQG